MKNMTDRSNKIVCRATMRVTWRFVVRKCGSDPADFGVGDTPSLTSWNADRKPAPPSRIDMPRRVLDLPLPIVSTIDLRVEFQNRYHRGSDQPTALEQGDQRSAGKRGTGHFTAESSWFFDAHPVSGLRTCGALPRL